MGANTTKKIKWNRAFLRSLYYYRIGYGTYLALPVSLFGYASSIYYLAINNIPLLKNIFPRFHEFLLMAFLIIYPMGALVGWYHFKRSAFFKAERDILAEANPCTVNKLPELNRPIWRLFKVLAIFLCMALPSADEYGLDEVVAHIDKVIAESESLNT